VTPLALVLEQGYSKPIRLSPFVSPREWLRCYAECIRNAVLRPLPRTMRNIDQKLGLFMRVSKFVFDLGWGNEYECARSKVLYAGQDSLQ
jgi:hypothetical protein